MLLSGGVTDNVDVEPVDEEPSPEELAIMRGHQLAANMAARLQAKGLTVQPKARAQLARWIAGLPIESDETEPHD